MCSSDLNLQAEYSALSQHLPVYAQYIFSHDLITLSGGKPCLCKRILQNRHCVCARELCMGPNSVKIAAQSQAILSADFYDMCRMACHVCSCARIVPGGRSCYGA